MNDCVLTDKGRFFTECRLAAHVVIALSPEFVGRVHPRFTGHGFGYHARYRYLGMRLVNSPTVRCRIAEAVSHSSVHAAIKDRPDVTLALDAGSASHLRPLRVARMSGAMHFDALESKREQWRGAEAAYCW